MWQQLCCRHAFTHAFYNEAFTFCWKYLVWCMLWPQTPFSCVHPMVDSQSLCEHLTPEVVSTWVISKRNSLLSLKHTPWNSVLIKHLFHLSVRVKKVSINDKFYMLAMPLHLQISRALWLHMLIYLMKILPALVLKLTLEELIVTYFLTLFSFSSSALSH